MKALLLACLLLTAIVPLAEAHVCNRCGDCQPYGEFHVHTSGHDDCVMFPEDWTDLEAWLA